jgi:hypothetical protein
MVLFVSDWNHLTGLPGSEHLLHGRDLVSLAALYR